MSYYRGIFADKLKMSASPELFCSCALVFVIYKVWPNPVRPARTIPVNRLQLHSISARLLTQALLIVGGTLALSANSVDSLGLLLFAPVPLKSRLTAAGRYSSGLYNRCF